MHDHRLASCAIRARWVLPADSPPIQDGLVVVERGCITSVGPTPREESAQLCHDAVVLPAFVNAHTHLEFSSLDQPLGEPGLPFVPWIRQVIAWRRERDADPTAGEARRNAAVYAGIDESLRAGVGCLGEIATSASSAEELQRLQVPAIVFSEQIGLSKSRIGPLCEQALNSLDSAKSRPTSWRAGLSPHAPYTVHPDLLVELTRIAAKRRVPIAMHLAETREELQLLRAGTGPFVGLLRELNAWFPDAIPPASRPLDYLRTLALGFRAAVIHGNYLDEEECQFLAEQRDRLTVVYCPRTHAYFGHSPYPLRERLDRGMRVAIGTDSRASNPDLSVRNELRFAAAQHPRVAPGELLRMATIDAAWALGFESELGSLRRGKRALLQTIPLPPGGASDPFSWLFASDQPA